MASDEEHFVGGSMFFAATGDIEDCRNPRYPTFDDSNSKHGRSSFCARQTDVIPIRINRNVGWAF
jgi:hypothetical protein